MRTSIKIKSCKENSDYQDHVGSLMIRAAYEILLNVDFDENNHNKIIKSIIKAVAAAKKIKDKENNKINGMYCFIKPCDAAATAYWLKDQVFPGDTSIDCYAPSKGGDKYIIFSLAMEKLKQKTLI